MKFVETPLTGAYVVELEPMRDERGMFARTFCRDEFRTIGFDKPIVQINFSVTRQKGTVRGIHYQRKPACETKIIRCARGEVLDVFVDLRAGSPTFLQWHGVHLSKDNMRMVYIPEGFGHGFQTLTDDVELIYHHSAVYSSEYEGGLRFDDPAAAIEWPLPVAAISPRDRSFPLLGGNFKGMTI